MFRMLLVLLGGTKKESPLPTIIWLVFRTTVTSPCITTNTMVFLSVALIRLVLFPASLRKEARWYGGLSAWAYCTSWGFIPSLSLPMLTHLCSSWGATHSPSPCFPSLGAAKFCLG